MADRTVVHELAFVHELAVVEEGVALGAGTRVWHHAHVRAGAVVGAGCNLGKDVFVGERVVVGDGCKLINGAFLPEGVHLGDEVFVGPGAVFTNDRFPRAASTDWELVPTTVGRGASIGANATVVCGVEIGEYATVGAGAVVTRSLEAHELVVGNPARRVGWVCACGHLASRAAERPADLRCAGCRDGGRVSAGTRS
jgi:UDP-2-acetamido-3-amino-2,3-dideoxy-glucuronate N-acetyltransferase